MSMRDYEDLKNLKIPAEQERIMDIIPEKSQPDEHCVAYWMNMPELPEMEK